MKIFFFHHSDNYIEEFAPHPTNKFTAANGNFYWFYDRYHNYTGLSHVDKYLYLFINDLGELNDLNFMQGNKTLEDLKSYYISVRNKEINGSRITGTAPIIRSKDVLQPSLVLEIDHTRIVSAKVALPFAYRGMQVDIFDSSGLPTPFCLNMVIADIVPDIRNALPFSLLS